MAEASSAEAATAVVVMMTAGSREEAARLAEMLVGAHLAACVQIMPEMESVYRWQGRVHREPEVLLLAKTTAACFAELEREVRALHTYDTPEIIGRADFARMAAQEKMSSAEQVLCRPFDASGAKLPKNRTDQIWLTHSPPKP